VRACFYSHHDLRHLKQSLSTSGAKGTSGNDIAFALCTTSGARPCDFLSADLGIIFTFILLCLDIGKHSVGLGIASAYRGTGATLYYIYHSHLIRDLGRPVSLCHRSTTGPDHVVSAFISRRHTELEHIKASLGISGKIPGVRRQRKRHLQAPGGKGFAFWATFWVFDFLFWFAPNSLFFCCFLGHSFLCLQIFVASLDDLMPAQVAVARTTQMSGYGSTRKKPGAAPLRDYVYVSCAFLYKGSVQFIFEFILVTLPSATSARLVWRIFRRTRKVALLCKSRRRQSSRGEDS
jgi:hypothetical protein